MDIYRIDQDYDFKPLYPEEAVTDEKDWEFFAQSVVDIFPPRSFKGEFDEEDRKLPIPDIAIMGSNTYAFSEKATELLAPILNRAGEVIPFHVEAETWYLLNVMESLDKAFDRANSAAEMEAMDGSLVSIQRYAFFPEHLTDSALFKIPDDGNLHIFCADRRDTEEQRRSNFFQIVQENGLTGLDFKKVFSA